MATSKTAAKTSAPRKAASGAKAASHAVAGVTVDTLAATAADSGADTGETSQTAANVMKTRNLVDKVALATGAKKKGLKEIVEATLAALGDALTRGDDLNLPPLGKAKVNRQRDIATGGEVLIVRIRRGGGGGGKGDDAQALAPNDD